MLLSDDEGAGRFAGLLRHQERQLGHSAMTCLCWTTLSLPPALPKDLLGGGGVGGVLPPDRFHDLI